MQNGLFGDEVSLQLVQNHSRTTYPCELAVKALVCLPQAAQMAKACESRTEFFY